MECEHGVEGYAYCSECAHGVKPVRGENMKVIDGGFRNNPNPADLPDKLRLLADQIEHGEATGFEGVYVLNDAFTFLHGASLANALVHSTLLRRVCEDRIVHGTPE